MDDTAVREHLCDLIRGGGAHVTFEEAFGDVPRDKRGVRPAGLPWSLWELLEHVRIAQWDILEFSRDPKNDLVNPFPWGDGQHLLREATLVADHNAYHIGQAIAVRRLLDDWSG